MFGAQTYIVTGLLFLLLFPHGRSHTKALLSWSVHFYVLFDDQYASSHLIQLATAWNYTHTLPVFIINMSLLHSASDTGLHIGRQLLIPIKHVKVAVDILGNIAEHHRSNATPIAD
jgi:hypothetical protein